jgi:hypothetical protein
MRCRISSGVSIAVRPMLGLTQTALSPLSVAVQVHVGQPLTNGRSHALVGFPSTTDSVSWTAADSIRAA